MQVPPAKGHTRTPLPNRDDGAPIATQMKTLPLAFMGLYTQAPPLGHVQWAELYTAGSTKSQVPRGGSHGPVHAYMRDVNSRQLSSQRWQRWLLFGFQNS